MSCLFLLLFLKRFLKNEQYLGQKETATYRSVILFYRWQCGWLIRQAHWTHRGSHGNRLNRFGYRQAIYLQPSLKLTM